jgi:NAD(P)-dependent dehydrogenase (short-subunit alcohol dehydrogenase family)
MAGRLEGRVAIVTGAAQGIGRALAEGLAAEGARIVVADLAGAEASAASLPTESIGVRVDVSSEEDVAAMTAAAMERFGRIDVLVNNAGIYTSLVPKPFEEIDAAEWRQVMDVNVLGMFLCCRAVMPHMKAQGDGRIVNIASGTPFKGVPFLLHYVVSKGAVVALTRALAKEVGGAGVLVNTVAPGFTMSTGVLENPVQIEKLQEVSVKARVIQRDQLPEDIVGAVVFLSGPESAFITGQAIVVDGGAYFN